MNRLPTLLMLALMLGRLTASMAAEPSSLAESVRDQSMLSPPPPALKLVGSFSTGDIGASVILSIDGAEHVLLLKDEVGEGWWLESIKQDHVLLTDGRQLMRLDLLHGRPYLVFTPEQELIEPRAQPIEVHTPRTHADLEPGQSRRFFVPSEEAVGNPEQSPLAQWEQTQREMYDSGMKRRFANGPAPLAIDPDEMPASLASAELEPGQSIRFGPVPPPDEIDPEEAMD